MIPPRKKSSTKRTPIPSELIEQIEDLMLTNFRTQLKRRIPVVSGYIFPEEIVIGVGLQTPKQLKQPRFDVSIDYNPKDNASQAIHLCVDLLAGLLEKLITEEDDQEFPLIWQDFEFEGKKVFIQYGTTNLDLEKAANKLLGMDDDDGLLQVEDEEGMTAAEILKAKLGLADDDPEDDGEGTH